MPILPRQLSILFTVLLSITCFALTSQASQKATILGIAFGDQDLPTETRQFVSPNELHKSLGYLTDSVWVKIKVSREESEDMSDSLLVLKNPLVWSSQAKTQKENLSKFSNFPFPSFQLKNIENNEEIFIRLKSDAALSLNFEVMTKSEYNSLTKMNLSIYAGYSAIVLLLAGLFFAYYISTKKMAALAYAAELVCFHFFAIISLFGVPLILLPEELHYFGTSFIVISECLACISIIWFSVEIVKKPFSRFESFLIFLACLISAASLLSQNIYMMSLTLIISILTTAVTIKTFYQNRKQNPYIEAYFVAFCCVAIGAFFCARDYLGFSDNFNSRFYIFAGSLLELSIITIALTKIFYQEQTHLQYYAATLGGLVSQATLQDIMTNKERITFETVSTDLTVIFVDIVGYTEASRALKNPNVFEKDVQQLLHLIRSYIIESGGEVNKTLGDGLLGYFGHSISGKKMENHAQIAVQCALRIQRAAIMWIQNQKFHFPFRLRIGLSSGECRIGNIALDRLDYTITGDTVVMAQRMESACSPLKVLVSENVIKYLKTSPEKVHEKLIHIKNQHHLVKAFEIDPFAGIQDYEKSYQLALSNLQQHSMKRRSAFQRFPISDPISFKVIDPQSLEFSILDVSQGGMLLKSTVDIARNIQLVGELLGQRIGCSTRWSKQISEHEYVVGVEFIRINTDDIEHIFYELTKNQLLKIA